MARYYRRIAQGLCCECGDGSVLGTTMCEKHLIIYRKKGVRRNKGDRQFRIDNRLCSRCSTPLEAEEGRTCQNCSSRTLRKDMINGANRKRIAA
jgi:DNA-directed RNA polymerase subunit RPC12/RpoP